MEPKTGVDPRSLLEHRDFVRAIVRRLLADEHAVDDVVQETFLRALERPPRPSALRSWLARVGRNVALTARRREKTRDRRERAGARPEQQPSASEAASKLERLRLVVEAVLALEEPFRSAILLRFYEDLPPREIARELGVPVDTVRSRLRRGLERLRAWFDARHGGDRAAWSLALLPLLGMQGLGAAATAAAGGGTKVLLVEGAMMSAKAKIFGVAAVMFVAAVVTVTWQAAAARDRAPSPRAQARPVAGVEGVRGTWDESAPTVPAEAEAAIEHLPDRGIGTPGAGTVRDDEKPPEPKPYRIAEATGDARGALRVIVTDDAGNGLAGAKVIVTDHETGRTDADGRAVLRPLSPGKRGVAVAVSSRFRSATVEVAEGRFTEILVVFDRGATVEGEVRHIGRGTLAGVGVAIDLEGKGGFQEWCNTRTDERGRYRIEGVPAGTHAVLVWGGFLGEAQRPRASLNVAGPGQVTKDILVGRVALKGTVRDADTLDPIPEARVSLFQPPRWNATATTDAYGFYEIPDLPPGSHTLSVGLDGYAPVWSKGIEIPAEEARTADFTLRRAATLVLEMEDRDGRAVPGTHTVKLSEPGGPATTFQIGVDSSGVGRYSRVLPGVYDLIVELPGYARASERVAIRPGETRVRLRLEPAETGRVSLLGTVRDATTKEPLSAVSVRIYRPFFLETSTGGDGVYRFRDLEPGTIALAVSKDGHGIRYLGEVGIGKEPRTLDLELDRAATLSLHVTDGAGRPVVGRIYLGINGRGEKRTEFGTNLDADAEGHAVYRQIVPGPYVLLVSKGDVGEATVETEIVPGENVVRVRLE